jgi:hypothetical protein
MVEFNTSGSSIVISFGLISSLLLVYLILQLVLSFKTKVLPFHRTFLFIKVLTELVKNKPKHWKFTPHNLLTPLSINKKEGLYQVFIRVKSKAYNEWTCDWVTVNTSGKIVSEQLTRVMNMYDTKNNSDIIQYNRNKNLKNLGL